MRSFWGKAPMFALRLKVRYQPENLNGELRNHLNPEKALGSDIGEMPRNSAVLANYVSLDGWSDRSKREYWAKTWIDNDLSGIPAETQAILFQQGKEYFYATTLCDGEFCSHLAGNRPDGMTLYLYTGIFLNAAGIFSRKTENGS